VFVIAVCGLIYELLAGTLSSYLLGDSVTHFSLVIGIFLSSMGLGAWLSKFAEKGLLRKFILVEVWVGLAGGLSAAGLFAAFLFTEVYPVFLFGTGGVVGTLIGFEIPLLIRILKEGSELRVTVSDVLAVDYIGALAASILFPTLLVPHLGLMRTGFLFGLMNVAVAGAAVWSFRDRLGRPARLGLFCAAAALVLGIGFVFSDRMIGFFDASRYEDDVIYARQTRFQKLVLTRWRTDLRLFINGNLQFSTTDEHRYHESLVHPALGLIERPERLLVLGGGDGMAVREALQHGSLREIVLVDIDPEMTRLFRENPLLKRLNNGSLSHPKVRVVNADAMAHLRGEAGSYDVIIMDLPDPNDLSVGKLYTRAFFRLARRRLRPGGVLVTQATSPFYGREAYWCIVNTMKEAFAGENVAPYHAYIPTFGEWGFVLASSRDLSSGKMRLRAETRFLDEATLAALFIFPKDLRSVETPINRLDDQVLVRLYEKGWRRFNF